MPSAGEGPQGAQDRGCICTGKCCEDYRRQVPATGEGQGPLDPSPLRLPFLPLLSQVSPSRRPPGPHLAGPASWQNKEPSEPPTAPHPQLSGIWKTGSTHYRGRMAAPLGAGDYRPPGRLGEGGDKLPLCPFPCVPHPSRQQALPLPRAPYSCCL